MGLTFNKYFSTNTSSVGANTDILATLNGSALTGKYEYSVFVVQITPKVGGGILTAYVGGRPNILNKETALSTNNLYEFPVHCNKDVAFDLRYSLASGFELISAREYAS